MSVTAAGSFFHQPQFSGVSRKPAEDDQGRAADSTSAADRAREQEEAKARRAMTPEEQEKLKRLLAGMADKAFQDILKQDAEREAQAREAQGLSASGAVLNISV